MRRALLFLAAATLLTACEDGTSEPEVENEPPVARLISPQVWHVDEEVSLDATATYDPDGRVVNMVATYGDGSEEVERQDGAFVHLFPSPGSFAVSVDVIDDDGAVSTVATQVVVVERLDEPICSCSLPCFEGGVCADAICVDVHTSDENDDFSAEGVLDCPVDDAGVVDEPDPEPDAVDAGVDDAP